MEQRGATLRRRRDGHVLGGVAGGLAEHLGVAPALVRTAFVVLTFAGGVGILLYVLGWLLLPEAGSTRRGPLPPRCRTQGTDVIDAAALGSITLGALLLLRAIGLWFPDKLVWPLVLASSGLALVWGRGPAGPSRPLGGRADDTAADPPVRSLGLGPLGAVSLPAGLGPLVETAVGALAGNGRRALARVGAGVVLVVGGAGAFLAFNGSFTAVRQGVLGALVVFIGLAMIFAPWLLRLSGDLLDERRARIRTQERAEMAAHLHDSVLQTLALIQKRADSPREVVTLARRQERELRAWLNAPSPMATADPTPGTGATTPTGANNSPTNDVSPSVAQTTVGAALATVAEQVEERYGVRVELVRVGDAPLDPDRRALVQAAGEAMVNAAKHAGVDAIDVYVETSPQRIEVYVRDRGLGFDVAGVPADRRGLAQSIVGRMERHGGRATLRSAPGEGTEVELVLPARAGVAV